MIRSDDNAVTVYYTDGTIEPVWVPICADRAGNSIFTVICRQFGYESHKNLAIQEADLELKYVYNESTGVQNPCCPIIAIN